MDDVTRRALGYVLQAEGGFVNDPRDPGGATNRGIAIGTLRRQGAWGDLDHDGDVDADDVQLIGVDEAARVYRAEYWSAIRGDALPPYLALIAFDAAVNQGPKTAVTLMQTALRVNADGAIGPRTLAVARDVAPVPALEELIARRAVRYGTRRSFPTFGLGWMRRLAHVHTGALVIIR